mgnify:CR=1 FL=1
MADNKVNVQTQRVLNILKKVSAEFPSAGVPPLNSKLNLKTYIVILEKYYEYLKQLENRRNKNGSSDSLPKLLTAEGAMMNNKSVQAYFKTFIKSVKNQQAAKVQFLKNVKTRVKNNKPNWMNTNAWNKINDPTSYVGTSYTNKQYENDKISFFRESDRPKVILFFNKVKKNSSNKVYGDINIPEKVGNHITDGVVDVYKTTDMKSVTTAMETLSGLEPPVIPIAPEIPTNVFFTGPSGSGKTTFSDAYARIVVGAVAKPSVIAYEFAIGYKDDGAASGRVQGARITFSNDKRRLYKNIDGFKARYIRPTPLNPESSRTHMFLATGKNIRIYDLAGKENPIDLSRKAFGFNIFDKSLQPRNMTTHSELMVALNFKRFSQHFSGRLEQQTTIPPLVKFIIAFIWNIFGPTAAARKTYGDGLPADERVRAYNFASKFVDTAEVTDKATGFRQLSTNPQLYKKDVRTGGKSVTAYMKGYADMKSDVYKKYVKPYYDTHNDAFPIDMYDQVKLNSSTGKATGKEIIYTSFADFAFDCILRCLEGYYINYCLYELKHVFLPDLFENHGNYMDKTRQYYKEEKRIEKYSVKAVDSLFDIELEHLTPTTITSVNNIVMFYPDKKKKPEEMSTFVKEVIANKGAEKRKQILIGVLNGARRDKNNINAQRNYYQNLKSFGMNKPSFEKYMKSKSSKGKKYKNDAVI